MWNCVDDKKDNEEGRAPLEYSPRGPRVSSYATARVHWPCPQAVNTGREHGSCEPAF